MTNSKKYTAFRYMLLNGEIVEMRYNKKHTEKEMYSYFRKWCKKCNEELYKVTWLEFFNNERGTWC